MCRDQPFALMPQPRLLRPHRRLPAVAQPPTASAQVLENRAQLVLEAFAGVVLPLRYPALRVGHGQYEAQRPPGPALLPYPHLDRLSVHHHAEQCVLTRTDIPPACPRLVTQRLKEQKRPGPVLLRLRQPTRLVTQPVDDRMGIHQQVRDGDRRAATRLVTPARMPAPAQLDDEVTGVAAPVDQMPTLRHVPVRAHHVDQSTPRRPHLLGWIKNLQRAARLLQQVQ